MGGLFKQPKIKDPEPPAPLPDEQELEKARRRRVAKESKSSSIENTVLNSAKRETLG